MPSEPTERYRDLLQHYQSAGLKAEWLDKESPEVVGKMATTQNFTPPRETMKPVRSWRVTWTSFLIRTSEDTNPDAALV